MSAKPRVRMTTAGWTRPAPMVVGSPVASFRAQHDLAKSGRRTADWDHASSSGPETFWGASHDVLRRRCRHEYRHNAMASRVVDYLTIMTIGSGIKPRIKDQKLSRLWNRFTEECDADGVLDFYALQALAFSDMVVAGDIFRRDRPRYMSDGYPVPLQIQLLASEMVPLSDSGGKSRAGIIFEGPGQRKGYLMHSVHPGDSNAWNATDLNFVSANTVSHIFQPTEPGQIRGAPWLTKSLLPLHDLDAYVDAELVGKKLKAMHAFWITTPAPLNPSPDRPAFVDEEGTPRNAESTEFVEPQDPMELVPTAEPGASLILPPGYDVKPSTPSDVGSQYQVFVRDIMRRICAGVNVPYCIAFADYAGMNDRLVSWELKQFAKTLGRHRKLMVHQFCKPTWRAFLRAAIDTGIWTVPEGTTEADWMSVEWVGEPMGYVHPVQEAQANLTNRRAGFKSRSRIIIEQGDDPDDVMSQIAEEDAAAAAAGMILNSDPRVVSKSGVTQARPTGSVLPELEDDPEVDGETIPDHGDAK